MQANEKFTYPIKSVDIRQEGGGGRDSTIVERFKAAGTVRIETTTHLVRTAVTVREETTVHCTEPA